MYVLRKQCIYISFFAKSVIQDSNKTKNAYNRCAPRVSIGIKHMATNAAKIKTADM